MAGKRGRLILVGLVVVLFVAALWVAAFSLAGRVPGRFTGEWDEEVLEAGGRDKIAVVAVAGEITSDLSPFAGGAAAGKVLSQLDQALEDPDVRGVVIDLETPGGTVVGSDLIYRKLAEVRDRGKPAVALMNEVAASGGYYIAAGATEVVANPATLTGSIGVILFIPNVARAADKVGIEPVVIKSGPLKDIGSPFRDMTLEERTILAAIIDEAYGQFVAVVAEGRELPEARVREIADGRIYTGRQAQSLGLVDHLGGRELAFSRARELSKAEDATVVRYTRSPGLLETVLGIPPGFSAPDLLEEGLGVDLRPGLKYLWLL